MFYCDYVIFFYSMVSDGKDVVRLFIYFVVRKFIDIVSEFYRLKEYRWSLFEFVDIKLINLVCCIVLDIAFFMGFIFWDRLVFFFFYLKDDKVFGIFSINFKVLKYVNKVYYYWID